MVINISLIQVPVVILCTVDLTWKTQCVHPRFYSVSTDLWPVPVKLVKNVGSLLVNVYWVFSQEDYYATPVLSCDDLNWFKQYLFEKVAYYKYNEVNIGFHNKIIILMLSHLLVKYLDEHIDEVST